MLEVLNLLKNTNSSKEKLSILNNNKNNQELFNILKYTYDKIDYTYGVTSETVLSYDTDKTTSDSLNDVLNKLSEREVTGHKALEYARSYYNTLDDQHKKLFLHIIDRDLKIGVNEKTLNKVWKGMIPKPRYCRCSVYCSSSKMVYPALIQLKCDGTYREAYVHNGNVSFKTRSGEPYQNPILSEIMKDLPNGYYTGEFTIGRADEPDMNRAEANGLINSDNPPYDRIHYTVWDYLTDDEYCLKSTRQYCERLACLESAVTKLNNCLLHVVPTRKVNNIDEALSIVSEWMKKGLEGGVLKSLNMKFKNGTSNEQLKIKLKVDADLRCVGFLKGTKGTKYENKNKVILFESSDGLVKGQCSGMTDAMVDQVTLNEHKYINTIVSIEFNDLSKSQDNNYYALLHPRFVEFRTDKDTADDLNTIVELRNMAKSL